MNRSCALAEEAGFRMKGLLIPTEAQTVEDSSVKCNLMQVTHKGALEQLHTRALYGFVKLEA